VTGGEPPVTDERLAVAMHAIVKRFPGVLANDGVELGVRWGEVHALLGENGAGKTTLMNILSGLYQPDEGTIEVDGAAVRFGSPRDAIRAGVGMVHQQFALVPSLTVTENVVLGLRDTPFRLNLGSSERRVAQLSERTGLRVNPRTHIWQLSVGEQQRVEILKMLYRGARVLILDEPTAVLAPQETEDLFRTLRGMTERGESIVLISHKLDEVLQIADRVTVLRRGRVTASGIPASGQTKRDLARLMVGREVMDSIDKAPATPGSVVLGLEDVHSVGDLGLPALRGVSLEVRAGEIVGLAGVAGNGQSELAEVVTGIRACTGRVLVNGRDLANQAPIAAIDSGVAHVPEDRHATGSAPNLSLVDNLIMKSYAKPPIGRGWLINRVVARDRAIALKDEYQVIAPSVDTRAGLLSGGNLQRLIFAREISSDPSLLVAVQPTRGLDVGAVEAVHRMLLARRTEGTAVLLISEDLDELLMLADRVAVIYEGRIAGVVDAADADIQELGSWMTGRAAADDAA
jgi:simple sugar transport system ATP-binding protein